MAFVFNGASIIVNYTSVIVDILLEDKPKIPAILGEPYITRGSTTPKLHIPFKFESDVSDKLSVNPIYNSLETEMILNSSMNFRLLGEYDIKRNRDIVGHKVILKTEILKNMPSKKSGNEDDNIILYSMFRPIEDINYIHKPTIRISQIMNPDENIIEMLYKNVNAYPARINRVFDSEIKPASTDYPIHFIFHNYLKRSFAGNEYNMTLNNMAMNKLMTLLDVERPNECLDKDVAIYIRQNLRLGKILICGMTSLDRYNARSAKF